MRTARTSRYRVAGALDHVTTSTSSDGKGTFSVVLTHYRYSLFVRCVIYKPRVTGSVSLSY